MLQTYIAHAAVSMFQTTACGPKQESYLGIYHQQQHVNRLASREAACGRCWKELCGDAEVEGVWQDSWQALEQLVASGQIQSLGLLHSLATVSSAESFALRWTL